MPHIQDAKTMNKRLLTAFFIAFFLFSVIVIPQIAYCQTEAPEPTPTEEAGQGSAPDLLLIGAIAAVVAVVVVVVVVVLVKRRVSEKSLRKVSARAFEDWVIKRFNGKTGDPSLGISGYTEGGQPLLIRQSDHVGLAEVEDFVKILSKGNAQRGAIVAFSFENDTLEGKVTALDHGIELELLRVSELLNKRSANKIKSLARSRVTFDPSSTYLPEIQVADTQQPFEKMPSELQKPLVFIAHSNTKVEDQVKKMLDFLHYDYVMGDKEETSVPIPEIKFGLMKNCDCAIINIAAAEQERRYSGLYILNANVISEINAAYLKYNTQVILLVERKIDLPSNFKGLKRIEYSTDDLSFDAAMDLEKILVDFKKL